MSCFDAIVIGSGMGGLTTAAILARLQKKRVLVLERHYRVGGFTHTFWRPGGFHWDVGLHYVGDLEPGSRTRKLLDFVTGGIAWNALPDIYDCFLYPGLRFDVPQGLEKYRAKLQQMFPAEAAAITRYFEDIAKAVRYSVRHFVRAAVPPVPAAALGLMNRLTARLPLMTTRAYLEKHFKDPALKALLASQWMDYGLPPSESAFVIHAVIVQHYLRGAWYPRGGAAVIADGARRVIEQAGGQILVNHEVTSIRMENGCVVGVQVQPKAKAGAPAIPFDAPLVISDAGARNTFQKLVPPSIRIPFRKALDQMPDGCTLATLYLGLHRDPRSLGFHGENYWIFESFDHETSHPVYLSFPSLKDQTTTHHTAEIIAPMSYASVAEFRDEPWRRRSAAYQEIKERAARAMLSVVERHFPGFSEMIAFSELSTPLSVQHFTGHHQGSVYGIPATPKRYRQSWLKPDTPVKGLYLTGVDAGSLGIVGALMGGVGAASRILGPFGFFSIMAAIHQPTSTRVIS